MRKIILLTFTLNIFLSFNAQEFAAPILNPFSVPNDQALSTSANFDFDADGDYDLFQLHFVNSELTCTYMENIGSVQVPNYGNPQQGVFGLDPITADMAESIIWGITAVDINNDNDFDIFVGIGNGGNQGQIFYAENTGTSSNPNFSAFNNNPFGINYGTLSTYSKYYMKPAFADIDFDGDYDMFCGNANESIVYFENIGNETLANFTSPVENPFNISLGAGSSYNFTMPTFADLDNDSDLDLLVGVLNGDTYQSQFRYLENFGTISSPSFGVAQINPFGLSQGVCIAILSNLVDLDNDGDLDILTGNYLGYTNFYENISPINSIKMNVQNSTKFYPNPVTTTLNVELKNPDEILSIELVDCYGKTISIYNNLISNIMINHLSNGVYILLIKNHDGSEEKHQILKL